MPHKTHHLRADSLAIMLSLANVGAHAEVSDKSQGASPCALRHVHLWLWQPSNARPLAIPPAGDVSRQAGRASCGRSNCVLRCRLLLLTTALSCGFRVLP